MTKVVSMLVAGIFFFSSLTGMGQWSFISHAQAKSFDLEEEDEEDFESDTKGDAEKKPSYSDDFGKDKIRGTKAKKDSREDRDFDEKKEKSLAVFYFFADSTAEKTLRDIARTVGSYLGELSSYRFFESEARIFNDFSFKKLSADLEKVQKHLENGKKLLDEGEAEDAVGKFMAAVDLLEKRIDVLYDYTVLAKALFYAGAAWKLLDEDTKAQDLFRKVLVIDADYRPDKDTDEDTVDFFEKIKSRMMLQPLGDLKVSSEPSGATVYVDGRIVGMTPMTVEGLTVGKHYWRIHKSGYRDVGGVVTVRDGGVEKIMETLEPGDGADPVAQLEKLAVTGFGSAEMMKQAVTVGTAANVDRLLAVHSAVEQTDEGTVAKVSLRLLDIKKAGYKEENISFTVPSSEDLSRAEDLRHSLDNLFADEFGFNPVSSIVSGSLSLDRTKKEDSVITKWWFWTIIGVVVAGAAGGGTAAALLLTQKKSSGATMTVDFTP